MPAALAPQNPPSAANVGYLLIGLSALLLALVLPILERKLGLRQLLLFLALVSLVPAGTAGLAPADDFPNLLPTESLGQILVDPWLWLAGLVLFLYGPLEISLGAWAPAYLKEVGRSPQGVSVSLAGFWLAFLGGRVVAATAPPAFVPWLLLLLLVMAATTVGNLMGIFRPTGATLGVWLFGLCLGPMLPSLVGLTLERFARHAAPSVGLLLALGSTSGLVLQPALEHFAQARPVRLTMRLVMLIALALAAPLLALCLMA
jgi:fucose permease